MRMFTKQHSRLTLASDVIWNHQCPSDVPKPYESHFQGIHQKICLNFFYDILIYSMSIEEHVEHLRTVFLTMQQHNLLAKKSKCAFGTSRVEYLGHFISREGVSTDSSKINAIRLVST